MRWSYFLSVLRLSGIKIIFIEFGAEKGIHTMKRIALTKAAIITPFILIPEGTVVINGRKIEAVGSATELSIPSDARVVDLEGLMVTPGLIDQHLHGGSGSEVMDGSPESIIRIAKFHATHGVTSFLATTLAGTPEQLARVAGAVRELERINYKGAHCLGLHLEGPFLSEKFAGINNSLHLRMPLIEEINYLQQCSNYRLKLVTMAPELPGALELARQLTTQGIRVSLGHTDADYQTALTAIEAGFSGVTHCGNQMRTFSPYEPGCFGAALARPELAVELIVDGIHLHPATVELIWRAKGTERLILVSDAMPPTGLPDGMHQITDGRLVLSEGDLRSSDGRVRVSNLTLEKAVQQMLQDTGCELTEAVRMATYNPARHLGINQWKGSLVPGKDADLIVMNSDFEVLMTMVDGEVISGLINLE